MKILHITTHMGGGIGAVIYPWVNRDIENQHTVLCLNYTYYKDLYNNFKNFPIHENMRNKYFEINDWIKGADIVVVHYWNHPFLFEFFANARLPKCRMVAWSHISGFLPPYVYSKKLVRYLDRLVFTSPISFKVREIENLPEDLKRKTKHIWSAGDVDDFFKIKPIPHRGFNIGYTGTLDFSKIHPNFVDLCSKVLMSDVKFIVVGVGRDTERIRQEVKDRNLESKFEFTGKVIDIKQYYAIFDVFGYPLNPTHFGTCELVLGEAMAAQVVPVVLNNPSEKYILGDNLEGFVSDEEYITNIERLYYGGPSTRGVMGIAAKDRSRCLYDFDKMMREWRETFHEMMDQEKIDRMWELADKKTKAQGYRIFIESLGDYGEMFEESSGEEIKKLFESNMQWKSLSKGSLFQYMEAFPTDPVLKKWKELNERF